MDQPNSYVPGECNIGAAEVGVRRKFGHGALGLTLLAAALLFYFRAAPAWRLLLFFPAMFSASGYLQTYFRFCVGFGFKSAYNFGALGGQTPVADEASKMKDRRKARTMASLAAMIGAMFAVSAYLLP